MPSGFFYGDLPPSLQKSYVNDPRTVLSEKLLEAGTSAAPLRGGATEGILRLANALLGGYQRRKLGDEYTQKGSEYNTALSSALQGIKPGHYDPAGTYVPTDASSVTSLGGALAPIAQDYQLAQLKSGLSTDAAVAAQRAENQYANWRDPEYRQFKIDTARAAGDALAPYRLGQLAIAQGQLGVAQQNADTQRTVAGNKPPIEVADPNSPTGRRYARQGEDVGGLAAPGPNTGKSSPVLIGNAQKNLLKLALAQQQLNTIREKWAAIKDTLAAGGGGQGLTPTVAGQQFDKAVADLAPTLRGIIRTPGEGATSNVETALYGATLPSRSTYEATTEQQMQAIQDQIDLGTTGYQSILSGAGLPEVPVGPPGGAGAAPDGAPQNVEAAKTVNGVQYVKVGGQWHQVGQ